MVRKKLMPRIFLLTSTASPSAMADWTGTMTTAKMTVLRSDAQKVSSENSRMKLSTPTNVAGCGEISRAFVKARMKVRMIGMIKKVISNTPAGTSIKKATVPGRRPDGLRRLRRRPRRSAGRGLSYVEVVTRCSLPW